VQVVQQNLPPITRDLIQYVWICHPDHPLRQQTTILPPPPLPPLPGPETPLGLRHKARLKRRHAPRSTKKISYTSKNYRKLKVDEAMFFLRENPTWVVEGVSLMTPGRPFYRLRKTQERRLVVSYVMPNG
jgi:hypothetical protein